MSKTTEGLLGAQHGKIGPLVGYKVGEQTRYRTYNEHHRKSNSKKAKQSRNHFSVLSHLASRFRTVTDSTLKYATLRDKVSSSHHLFIRMNHENFTAEDEFDFVHLTLGDGKMATIAINSIETQIVGDMTVRKITFSSKPDGASFPTDMIFFALYNKERDEVYTVAALRGQNDVTLTTYKESEADAKYLYAVAVNTREVESSSHFGTICPKESSKTICAEL